MNYHSNRLWAYPLSMCLFCAYWVSGQTLRTTVRGQVVEKNAKLPIPAAQVSVVLDGQQWLTTLIDSLGYFKITSVPIGRRSVVVRSVGFDEQILGNLVLTSSKDFVLNVELQESLTQLQEVVIKANTDKSQPINALAAVSARQFTVEESRRYAGSFLDVSRMATNFAGVSAPNSTSSDIVVRGNSPVGVLWRLEGVDIPSPSHLAFVGTEGGYSLLNVNTLANSDFLSGAFPAEYGNRNAAVFDLKMRRGNPERYEFTGQIGLSGLELGVEGPIKRRRPDLPNASFLVSGRYFALDIVKRFDGGLLDEIEGIPTFKDAAFKLHVPTRRNGFWSIFGVGGLSNYARDRANESSDRGSNTGVIGANYAHFFSKKWRGTLTLAYSGNNTIGRNRVKDSLNTFKLTDELSMLQAQAQVKYEVVFKPNVPNLFKFGASLLRQQFDLYRNRLSGNAYVTSFDESGRAVLSQVYAHWQRRFSERWTLNAGLFAQYFGLNATKSVEPRLSAQYQAAARHRFSGAFGVHNQTQPLVYYMRQFSYKNAPQPIQTNRDLAMTRSVHVVVAHDWSIGDNLRLKTELYRQNLSRVPSRRGNVLFSGVNAGAVESSILNIPDSLTNDGKAYNQGLELTFERFFTKNYYFLTTLSLYDSKFRSVDGVWRNTSFGHGYVWNALGGYEWTLGKSGRNALMLDGKINFIGGKPYIPVDLPASVRRNTYVADVANAYLRRLPPFNRLDVKVSWRLNRPKVAHFIYVELNNIFDSKGYLEAGYDALTKRENFRNYQLGFLPIAGYRVEWAKRR